MTRKTEILEKFLNEFSRICQNWLILFLNNAKQNQFEIRS